MVTMQKLKEKSIDIILTSPFYNTNKKAGKNGTIGGGGERHMWIRYDTHVDNMTDEEYNDFTVKLFNSFDRILSENGCILYNISYGAENTDGMFEAVNAVITRTDFTIADVICWKKSSAFPNNMSCNRLTRIWEFVFVFCRKKEKMTFKCNKKVVSHRKTGQKMYENVFNFIEAKNNDEINPYNKATYSSDLCRQLLSIYAKQGDTVYDPFMGTGTTAVACKEMGLNCYGSEISENQCEWAKNRLQNIKNSDDIEYRQLSFEDLIKR